jgi:competence protein ComEC
MLRAHFLNVGHGDCTMIELPSERIMMVDINNSKSLPEDDVIALARSRGVSVLEFKTAGASGVPGGNRSWEEYYRSLLVDPHEYWQEKFSGKSLFRYIQTHPDMDHMGGLFRFFYQNGAVPLSNFWDTDHDKDFVESDFDNSPYSWADWVTYKILRSGTGRDDSKHAVLKNFANSTGLYWTEDGIEIFSPTSELVDACKDRGTYNNLSYVLKISHGGRSIILPGDAETDAWSSIRETFSAADLQCDILKAAHHGRESGYNADAVADMSPSIVICSVGKKPATDASDEYASHGARVLSTRYNGTITVTIWDDGDLWVDNSFGQRLVTMYG